MKKLLLFLLPITLVFPSFVSADLYGVGLTWEDNNDPGIVDDHNAYAYNPITDQTMVNSTGSAEPGYTQEQLETGVDNVVSVTAIDDNEGDLLESEHSNTITIYRPDPEPQLPGDTEPDGDVDMADYVFCRGYLNKSTAEFPAAVACDVYPPSSPDGMIRSPDLIWLRRLFT